MTTYTKGSTALDVIEAMSSVNAQVLAYKALANSALFQATYRLRRYLELQAKYPVEGFEPTLDERNEQDTADMQGMREEYNRGRSIAEQFRIDGVAAARLYNTIFADMAVMPGLTEWDRPMSAAFYFDDMLKRPSSELPADAEAEIRVKATLTGKPEEFYRLQYQLDSKQYREGFQALRADILDIIEASGTLAPATALDHVPGMTDRELDDLPPTLQLTLASRCIDSMLNAGLRRVERSKGRYFLEAMAAMSFVEEACVALGTWIDGFSEERRNDIADALANGFVIPDIDLDKRKQELKKRQLVLLKQQMDAMRAALAA